MKSMHSDIWHKLRRAEKRFESLSREFQSLESEKRAYLQEIMKGRQLFREVKEADQAIKKKGFAISKAKEKVGNLRSLLEGELGRFRKELIEEKQRELNYYMEERTRYLKRIEELEVETSRYRYLITGKKDGRLADVKDPLPSDIPHQDDFEPIDEVIGHIKLEVHRIIRMSSGELLKEYLARGKKDDQDP
jgi:chromosome segregation ATPase